jgi:hypothetical protein
MLLPFTRSQGFKVLFEHLEGELFIAWMAPAIAVDAPDQYLAVSVDLH